MKKILWLIAAVCAVNAAYLYPQEEAGGGIIYGSDWACLVSAPEGWLMDSESLSHYNIFALFYERGKTFGGSTPIIYVNTAPLPAASDEAMEQYSAWDLNNSKKRGAAITRHSTALPGVPDTHYIFTIENANGQFETILYRRYKTTCFSVILNAPTKAVNERLFPKLEETAASMRFMDKSAGN